MSLVHKTKKEEGKKQNTKQKKNKKHKKYTKEAINIQNKIEE